MEEEKRTQERLDKSDKEFSLALEKKKQYAQDRREYCFDIYQAEKKNWNNTESFFYNESDDLCHVRYTDPKPKTKAECSAIYGKDDIMNPLWVSLLLCFDGMFDKTF